MDPQKSNMTVLAQIVKQIPAKIIDSLVKKFRIQTKAFSPTSHVVTLLYEHLAHSLSLNDVCDSLQHHSGILSQIRRCTPPTRNGLSYANRNRNADMAEELFWYVYNDLKSSYPAFFTSSRSYPGLPHRIRRTLMAFDSTTIHVFKGLSRRLARQWACRTGEGLSRYGTRLFSERTSVVR